MNKLLDFFWVLIRPSFWFYTGDATFSKQLDDSLNALLDEGTEFFVIDPYEARLGSYLLWITNYPYAAFTTKIEFALLNGTIIRKRVRPSRRTIERLRKALLKQEPVLEGII